MCTLIILRRPDHDWPVMLAANRDEMIDRPWRPPGRHWPDRDHVVAGLDVLAGGSWLGLNDDGVVAGVLNRVGSLGPAAGKRSRGELVLEALDHADAAGAAAALADLEPDSYRPFNLLVADIRDAFWLSHRDVDGRMGISVAAVPAGLSMLTAHDLNDRGSPRIRDYLPRFRSAPSPETDDWQAWRQLLSSRLHDSAAGPAAAMSIVTDTGFGTVSSSLIALPNAGSGPDRRPSWRFAPRRPSPDDYADIPLG